MKYAVQFEDGPHEGMWHLDYDKDIHEGDEIVHEGERYIAIGNGTVTPDDGSPILPAIICEYRGKQFHLN